MRRVRVDLRLVGAALLALVAGLGVLALTRPPQRVIALVAAEPIPAGVPLSDTALREIPTEPLEGLVLASEREELAGHTIAVPLTPGWPLTHSILEPPSATRPDLIGLTLERGHAVQGLFVPGDLVDIYVSDDDGTRLLAPGVQVMAVDVDDGGFGSDAVSMVIAVEDRSLIPVLVSATHTGALDLALVSP